MSATLPLKDDVKLNFYKRNLSNVHILNILDSKIYFPTGRREVNKNTEGRHPKTEQGPMQEMNSNMIFNSRKVGSSRHNSGLKSIIQIILYVIYT